MALSVSALSNSGHVPINLPADGSMHSCQWVLKRLLGSKYTVGLECFTRLGLDPFAINVGHILLEEGRIVKLAITVSG